MTDQQKRALLIVSYGTSVSETIEKTIGRIESDLAAAFPDCQVYRAWTSKFIIEKLLKRDGIKIFTVEEAVRQMLADGMEEVIVQPTHLLVGMENGQMIQDVKTYGREFMRISFGAPLLAAGEDQRLAIQAVMAEFAYVGREDVLIFMGHGTSHDANAVFDSLDRMFKEMGYGHVFLGTMKSHSFLDRMINKLRSICPGKIYLAPFMAAAGNHAIQEMAGADRNSWKSRLQAEGFEVVCVMKGLGEYAGIRELYTAHGKAAQKKLVLSGQQQRLPGYFSHT